MVINEVVDYCLDVVLSKLIKLYKKVKVCSVGGEDFMVKSVLVKVVYFDGKILGFKVNSEKFFILSL